MSHEDSTVPLEPEKDQYGGDELPTYDDLAAQHGPNSRFGRWRQWIEKRAAERYADITAEDLQRRRARGWGEGVDQRTTQTTQARSSQIVPTTTLRVETDFSESQFKPLPSPPFQPPEEPAALIPEQLSPSHLHLYNFGSRFLPHSIAPIRCLLPLLNDHLLLIGHDDGLSVLDMFPREWNEEGLVQTGPADAVARPIWQGEGVYQMSILEVESTGQGTPQGVVLALVGSEPDSAKEQEGIRTLRMYNLASLVSLARWAILQKGARPVDLRQGSRKRPPPSQKKHRPHSSLAKGLKNLVIDSPISQQSPSQQFLQPRTSYSSLAESSAYSPVKERQDSSDSADSSWDVVEDLPLRWATHYTPLASTGSRLLGTSVLFYELWKNDQHRGRGGVLLAVATKSTIFLYEAPKGERAFRLMKEFYTPIPAQSFSFIQQAVQDMISRSPSDAQPRASTLQASRYKHARFASFGANVYNYPQQLSLFVIFEKKAGLIRIADAAVGEVEMYDENGMASSSSATLASPLARRSRASWDGRGFSKETKAMWLKPIKVDLPAIPDRPSFSQSMYILTRGKQSQIVPYPLPANVAALPPYRHMYWSSTPNSVRARICSPDRPDDSPAFLQVIAFGEAGIEVQEIPLYSLSERKGKSRAQEPLRAQCDVGGDAGFLCAGGHWDQPAFVGLARSYSNASYDSSTSIDALSSEELVERMHVREGMYGWVRKGHEDWRVFWVGGRGEQGEDDSDI
ncbi:hypothetical protein OBBRIDRAFT_747898 [Obba rivulosa]|uniref:Uncharacterized protein n=1 Tax=Obba rivulosa TaxID=1052685 RepID=A0A8E2J477_9APHY|nr:hypothetical protein OBBRIDRAFT_747898 [Obba rivulosa]